ncbi:MAG: hypothetical protein CML29_03890 [Rhizobiales bacterium]|nr:hypothetical protein [Hyphomicrobiales bacterium]MBA70492.1 hypothetical protein [Hyphomicrobiales bacterium]
MSNAEPGALELSAAPDLRDYLKGRGYLDETTKLDVLRTGPNDSSSGISDIYALQYLDAGNCGSAGCTQIIVTKAEDGAFLLYEEWLGTGLTMLDTETDGARDLVIRTDQGVLEGRFNGTKYVWSPTSGQANGASANPTVKQLGQTTSGSQGSNEPAETSGQCIDDHVWHGYANGRRAGGGGALGYGLCRTNREANLLLFSCKPGAGEVEVAVNMTTRRLDDSDPVTVALVVDGTSFEFKGTAYYDVMTGQVEPELAPISLDHPLFAALETADGSASLSINGDRRKMTLSGAPGAAAMMKQACAAPLNPAEE